MATILVVEDDKLSQRLLGKLLGASGHTALPAESPDAAWALLNKPVLPDLLILDNHLGRSWGWELLQRVRAHPIFAALPVIVYTAHTERSSIIKYVELGVQGMLVKPYKADAINAEVDKAIAGAWTHRVIEPAASACQRLQIKERDYYSMLSATASLLEKDLQTIRHEIAARRADARIRDELQHFAEESVSVGIPLLKTIAENLARAVEGRNTPEVQSQLLNLTLIQQILRDRALGYLGISLMASATEHRAVHPGAADNAPVRVAAPSKTPVAAYCRRTAGAPLWAAGAFAKRFGGRRFVSAEELEEAYARAVGAAPFPQFFESFEFLRTLPYAGLDEIQAAIAALPGFEAVYLQIARELGSFRDETAELTTAMALTRLGIYRTAVLLVAAKLAHATDVSSPLELRYLREHTLCVAVLAYEVAHSLHLHDEQLCVAGGFAHDLGKWFFALTEPVLYGIALSAALATEAAVEVWEEEIFGANHEVAGAALLRVGNAPVLLQEAASNHRHVERVDQASHLPVIAAVALANHLAWTASAETEQQRADLRSEIANPRHAVWEAFARAGTELPLDIPELVDTLQRVANTSRWISETIVGWAAKKPVK